MRVHVVPALALLALASCTRSAESSVTTTRHPIINGTADNTAAHKAVVIVYNGGELLCSGTYIGPRTVLTAGHCLDDQVANHYEIGFGDDMNTAARVGVVTVMRHPDYDGNNIVNDVGLIRLAADAPADIVPIPPLPKALALTSADLNATVDFIGFGNTSGGWNASYGTKLQVPDTLDVICDSDAGCLFKGDRMSPWTICYDQQPGGPCSGDSGGPATLVRNGQEYVVGITSYGDQSCAIFGCSTKVDHFADFIEGFLHPKSSGEVCSGPEQCLTGFCASGVCCDRTCEPPCEVCAASAGASADGVCTVLSGSCDDGNLCTVGDVCAQGGCKGEQKQCPAADQCHFSYCNRADGECVLQPKGNGSYCDDGNACTDRDSCQQGVCVGNMKSCPAPADDCHEASCDSASGLCGVAPKADGTVCADGKCHAGECSRCGCSSAGSALPGLALLGLGFLRRRRSPASAGL